MSQACSVRKVESHCSDGSVLAVARGVSIMCARGRASGRRVASRLGLPQLGSEGQRVD